MGNKVLTELKKQIIENRKFLKKLVILPKEDLNK